MTEQEKNLLEQINSPADLKNMSLGELEALAAQIRQTIIETTRQNGGHLASNLGVVELTLALHHVFDSPRDKIIWDVGHQAYTHKIVTGRRGRIATIRTAGGLSGFPKREESPHDAFGTGHSSTSISAALGMAEARDLRGESYDVVAVIGDGALTGGMALEALNNAGQRKTRMVIILNDNEMSISPNVGALAEYLQRMRTKRIYMRAKLRAKSLLGRTRGLGRYFEILKNSLKYIFVRGVWFEELGIRYMGPIDGHDIGHLIDMLKRTREYDCPVLLHVSTRKGKGYEPAEEEPARYHGVTSCHYTMNGHSYPWYFSNAICEAAAENPNVVAITAAMPEACGLQEFSGQYPDRMFDVGITEPHAATMAAGMAASGVRPVFCVYNTFLQRAYDSIVHDICAQNLPVVLAVFNSGLSGEDGETHQGVYGISFLSHIPNLTIYSPVQGRDVAPMLRLALEASGPTAILMPKGAALHFEGQPHDAAWRYCRERAGARTLVLCASGRMLAQAIDAAAALEKEGISVNVAVCPTIKPVEGEFLQAAAQRYARIYTAEDNAMLGGFHALVDQALQGADVRLGAIGVGDHFVPHGEIDQQMTWENMDAAAITARIRRDLIQDEGIDNAREA